MSDKKTGFQLMRELGVSFETLSAIAEVAGVRIIRSPNTEISPRHLEKILAQADKYSMPSNKLPQNGVPEEELLVLKSNSHSCKTRFRMSQTCPFCSYENTIKCNCGNDILTSDYRKEDLYLGAYQTNNYCELDLSPVAISITPTCSKCNKKFNSCLNGITLYIYRDNTDILTLYNEKIKKEEEATAKKEAIIRLESKRKRQIEQKIEKDRIVKSVNEQQRYFNRWFDKILIIDSNIWMNPEYDAFFLTLEKQLSDRVKKLSLFGPQFDEICNIKKKTSYGEAKNKKARCALNRIEKFQLMKSLKIEPITLDAEKNAYADPLLIQLTNTNLKAGKEVCFITDDMELRIRIRSYNEDNDELLEVIKGDDFLQLCIDYCDLNNIPINKDFLGEINESILMSSDSDN